MGRCDLVSYKYRNPKRIGFVDKQHYKRYPYLSIGQYLKRIVKIKGKIFIKIFDNKDCINHYFELKDNISEEGIDKIIRSVRKAGCIFDGYSINTH